jgi:hypothetical protein
VTFPLSTSTGRLGRLLRIPRARLQPVPGHVQVLACVKTDAMKPMFKILHAVDRSRLLLTAAGQTRFPPADRAGGRRACGLVGSCSEEQQEKCVASHPSLSGTFRRPSSGVPRPSSGIVPPCHLTAAEEEWPMCCIFRDAGTPPAGVKMRSSGPGRCAALFGP